MQKFRKIVRWAILISLAAVLMDFARIQAYCYPSWHSDRLNELLPKFGDALLIAWFIALIVDIGSKKELLADILFDASAHIIGRQLPEEIREEVREYLNAQFVRPLWKISYEISQYSPGVVELKSSYWGEVENLTTKRRIFLFSTIVDPSWVSNAPDSKLLRIEARLNQKNILKNTASGLTFQEPIDIGPGVSGRCETLLECVEYFPSSYEYPLINEATVQSTELTIHWEKKQFDIEV